MQNETTQKQPAQDKPRECQHKRFEERGYRERWKQCLDCFHQWDHHWLRGS